MTELSDIRPGMKVVGSDREPIGTVDAVEPAEIVVARQGGERARAIPLQWIVGVDAAVHLDKASGEVIQAWRAEDDLAG